MDRGLARAHDHESDERSDQQRATTHEAVAERRRSRDDVAGVSRRRGRLHRRRGATGVGVRLVVRVGRTAGVGGVSTAVTGRGGTAVPRVGARDGDRLAVADRAVRDEHPELVGAARRPRERTRLGTRLRERELLRDVLRPVADDDGLRKRDVVRTDGDDVVHTRTVRGRREREVERRTDHRRRRVAGGVEGVLVDEQGLGRGVEPVRDREGRRERVDGHGDRARERRDDADGVALDVRAGTVDREATLHLGVAAHGGHRNREGGLVVGTGAGVADLTDGGPRVGRSLGVGRRGRDDDGQ